MKNCLGFCPKFVCVDHCRIKFEKCRSNEEVECEVDLRSCEKECEDVGVMIK